jgi:HPt (histidine-containing phosphotransfer) domain-containing protein
MATDKAACLEAGMVDHVSKPIDLDQLIATLHQHIDPERLEIARTAETAVVSNDSLLDSKTAIKRLGNSHELYTQVVHSFRADMPDQLADLKRQIEQQAFPDAIRSAHTIKGLAATLGAQAMAKTAADFESRLKQATNTKDSAPDLSDAIAQLETQFEQLLPELAEIAPESAPPKTGTTNYPVIDRVTLIRQLNELKQLLADDDMRATQLGKEIGLAHGGALGTRWAAIDQAMTQLDFSAALSACILLQDSLAEND